MNTHDVGDKVRVNAQFTVQATSAAVDPGAVFLSIRPPKGPTVTYTYLIGSVIVRDGVGAFHADINIDKAGKWYYRWHSTGDGQAADENSFEVEGATAI